MLISPLYRWLQQRRGVCASLLVTMVLASPASAGTIVHVQTSMGNFFLELNNEAAPATVANFVNYVNSGRYNNTFVHASEGGSLIRGGGFGFNQCAAGPIPIQTDPPIPFEQTGLSNLNGTIAMAHPPNDVDGATSQWFINIADSPLLDTFDGGSAVFGRVIGDGMSVVTAIAGLDTVLMGGAFSDVPVINFFGFTVDCNAFSRENLVLMLMSVAAEDSAVASSNFDNGSGLLNVNVDLGIQGFLNVSFTLLSMEPQTVIQAQLDTVKELATPLPDMAQFDAETGTLVLPELAVDGALLFRDVVFTLTDEEEALFTLVSFD